MVIRLDEVRKALKWDQVRVRFELGREDGR